MMTKFFILSVSAEKLNSIIIPQTLPFCILKYNVKRQYDHLVDRDCKNMWIKCLLHGTFGREVVLFGIFFM